MLFNILVKILKLFLNLLNPLKIKKNTSLKLIKLLKMEMLKELLMLLKL